MIAKEFSVQTTSCVGVFKALKAAIHTDVAIH